MNLTWVSEGYVLRMDSARESQLVRDMLIEADYALHRLSDTEYRLRLGVGRDDLQSAVDGWQANESASNVSVAHVELIRACWSEALDFLSDTEFHLRVGWTKAEARALFDAFMRDRRTLTIRRQWE